MINMNEIISGITLSKACSIKADEDSTEKKTIHLKVKFDGVTLSAVFGKALSSRVISWQNGTGRKSFDKLTNNQTVEVQFVGTSIIDPMDSIIASAKAEGITVEQYIRQEIAKRTKTTEVAE